MFNEIKMWLKKSGWKDFGGDEVLDSLNPLDAIIEDPKEPWTRIYRESFWVGLADTWRVFMGNYYGPVSFIDVVLSNRSDKTYKGLLDLLLFPSIGRWIAQIATNIMDSSCAYKGWKQDAVGSLGALLILISTPLHAAKIIIAAALTLALSPIVAVVHLYAYFKALKLNDKIKSLKVHKYFNQIVPLITTRPLQDESFLEELKSVSAENPNGPVLVLKEDDKEIYLYERVSSSQEWKITGPLVQPFDKIRALCKNKEDLHTSYYISMRLEQWAPGTSDPSLVRSNRWVRQLRIYQGQSELIIKNSNDNETYLTIARDPGNLQGLRAIKKMGLIFQNEWVFSLSAQQQRLVDFEKELEESACLNKCLNFLRYKLTGMTRGPIPSKNSFEIKENKDAKGSIDYRMANKTDKGSNIVAGTIPAEKLKIVLGDEHYEVFLSRLRKSNFKGLYGYLPQLLTITSEENSGQAQTPGLSLLANDPASRPLLQMVYAFSGHSDSALDTIHKMIETNQTHLSHRR